MPIDEAALAAAMDAGIQSASSTPAAPTTPAPEAPDATQTTADALVDTSVEGADQSADGVGVDAPVGDETADGAAADKPADDGAGVEPAAADGGDKPAAVVDPAAPAKELTREEKLAKAINDPLPNALKKETKERFETVVGELKDKTARLQRVEGDFDRMITAVESTRASPVQYSQALTYLSLVNSESIEDKRQALQFMQQEIRALATILGEPVPGVNFLEGHDDLIREVGEGRITHQRAVELAAARAQRNRATQIDTQRQQQTQQGQQLTEARERARGELNALGAELQTDPQYRAKMGVLGPALKEAFKQIHPSEWAPTMRRAYAQFKLPAAPAPAPAALKVPANTPLRAHNPAGGQLAEPKNSMDAIDNALKSLGR